MTEKISLADAIRELEDAQEREPSDYRQAMIELAEMGLIVPTGERRDGRLVWVEAPNFQH
jgi:hypothetical protein